MSHRMPRHDQTLTEPVANTFAGSVKNAQLVSGSFHPVVCLGRVGRTVTWHRQSATHVTSGRTCDRSPLW